jgi:hypothetical protein
MRYELNEALVMKAAREWGQAHGFKGNQGGWISHQDAPRHSICQGWWLLGRTRMPQILDWYTRKLTAFESMNDMVLHTAPSYRPTILPRDWRHVLLADAYDWRMARRGDSRRAYRGAGSNVAP